MESTGYKDSRLWLNKYLSTIEKWDKAAVEGRIALMTGRFLKIWDFPSITIAEDTESGEVNIFEAEEPKHKKLEYAIFLGSKLEIREVAKLYIEVFKQLFELQPETFFSSEIGTRIGLTKNPLEGNSRQPIAINDTYFIEGNLDNVGKFDRIKQALTAFDLEDELTIKYANDNN